VNLEDVMYLRLGMCGGGMRRGLKSGGEKALNFETAVNLKTLLF
jgi:hypothetical protein